MNFPLFDSIFISHAWQVLFIFMTPFGGGIPAGVVLGDQYGLSWPILTILYFISDLVLACIFEPILLLFVHKSKTNPKLAKIREALSRAVGQTIQNIGINPSPFSLIMITFGTDPMTGRSIAYSYGHRFFTGWMIAIAGDMLFFLLVMASTLWLNHFIGNGTATALIVMTAILFGPTLWRKIKSRWKK